MIRIKNYQLFLILLFCFSYVQGKFKINDIEIDTITSPGNWITCDNFKSGAINITIEDNDFKINNITLSNPDQIEQCYYNLISQGLSKERVGTFSHMQSGGKIKQNCRSSEAKGIFYQADSIEIADSIFKASSISLMGKMIKLDRCYVDAFTLEIESNVPTNQIQVIRFIFDANLQTPSIVEGEIDFKNNTIKNFLIIGIKKIEILFRPHAFRSKTNLQ